MKTVGTDVYVHLTAVNDLPEGLYEKADRAIEIFRNTVSGTFQVVKVSKKLDRVSLLGYPKFWDQNFPELTESWTMDFMDGGTRVQHRKYSQDNPPILHRKELLLRADHPDIPEMKRITQLCEAAGCFEESKIIGRRATWIRILAEKGVSLA